MNKLLYHIHKTVLARTDYLILGIGKTITKFLRKHGYVAICKNGKWVWEKKKE